MSGPESAQAKPPHIRELTPRSIICGLAVAAILGASYPYVVLKLGFGPNVSVVAAFFGFLTLGFVFKDYNRWENNMVQTAGTAGAQTAFMCILLAAFDILRASKTVHFDLTLTPLQSFAWLTTAGLLGVLLAVPFRQHFIVDEKLPYPDGMAAGETLIVLDGQGAEGRRAALTLGSGALASGALMLMRDEGQVLKWFRDEAALGTTAMRKVGLGLGWSLLPFGSGMLVGLRVTWSMLIGMTLSWVIAPHALPHFGFITPAVTRRDVLLWVMWPATGMLVAGGLTAVFLRWKLLVNTFRNLSPARTGASDFPLSWVAVGVLITGTALVVVQKVSLGLEVWVTVTAIVLSLPLMLVGLRVLGETNWGPISTLSNLMQGVFGFLAPGHLSANMAASGTTGTIATESEALIQDFKAGDMIGSTPRYLTIMQLLGTPVGAAAVSWMYPRLRDTYGVVGETAKLVSPTSVRWAGFAEILSGGISAMPRGSLSALCIASALGVALTLLEGRWRRWVPSPTGMGIGMIVPASAVTTMFLGGLTEWVWRRFHATSYQRYMVPLASGLIAGEAIMAVIITLLIVLGIIHV
jgi:uncharacterized oligopeptide transporter (OPT) family protein